MSTAGTTTSPKTAAPKPETRATDYVILEFNQSTDEWKEHGDRISSTSSETAIRKHAESIKAAPDPRTPRTFVAVPARSFQPVRVTAEVQTTIKLSSS